MSKLIEMKNQGRKRQDLKRVHERYAGLTSVTLSDNQLAALRLFDPTDDSLVLGKLEGLSYPQGTWNSMEYRGYITYSVKHAGFKLTETGKKHLLMMYTKDIRKERPSTQFGKQFRDVFPALAGKFKLPADKAKTAGGKSNVA